MKTLKVIDKLIFRFLFIILGLAFSEFVLRMCGYRPWTYLSFQTLENRVLEEDAELGWVPKPGVFRGIRKDGNTVTITINPNSTRKTSNTKISSSKKMIVLGDSVIFGYGLNDEDSMFWILQEKLPEIEIQNFAVSGYGMLQNMIRFRKEFKNTNLKASIILIGYGEYLMQREIAAPHWVECLSELDPKLNLKVPYAYFNELNQLAIVPAKPYFLGLPLREMLASVRIIETIIANISARKRTSSTKQISLAILSQLITEVRRTGATPIIFLRRTEKEEPLINHFAKENNVRVVRCVDLRQDDPEYQLPGDTHPGSLINKGWAECLLAELKK